MFVQKLGLLLIILMELVETRSNRGRFRRARGIWWNFEEPLIKFRRLNFRLFQVFHYAPPERSSVHFIINKSDRTCRINVEDCTYVVLGWKRWFRVIGAVTITQGIRNGAGQRQSIDTSRASFALAVKCCHAFCVTDTRSRSYIRFDIREVAASVTLSISISVRICFFCRNDRQENQPAKGDDLVARFSYKLVTKLLSYSLSRIKRVRHDFTTQKSYQIELTQRSRSKG